MKTLDEIIAAFDVAGKKFEWHDIVKALCELPDDERLKPQCHYEWTAFMLQPNDSDKTFGGYFGPQATFAAPDGTPVYSPALSDITPDAILYWEQRYKSSSNAQMKMRYSGLVWDFKRRILNSNYDNDLYRTYVDSMLEVCNNNLTSHPVVTTIILERLFNITKNQVIDLSLTKKALRDFEARYATDQSARYWACQFMLMIENKKYFTKDEIDALVSQHEDRLKRLATTDKNGKIDVWSLDSQCDILANYYNRLNLKDEVLRVLKVSEVAHKKSFDTIEPMQKMGILEILHRKFLHYGLQTEANRLLPEIQSASIQAASTMQPHKYEFKIPKEVFDEAELLFGSKAESDEKRWQNFVGYFVPCKNKESKSLAETIKHHPLQYMMSTNMMDTKGRPQSIIGSYEKDPEGNLVMHITEKMNFGTHFLEIAISKMREIDLLQTERIMKDIIEPCPLFEVSSYSIIRQALDFLFDDQPVLACHLLVPQIETAIRNLVEMSGISVIKHQKHVEQGFQLITLDDLLREKPVEQAFTADGVLYLRLVLTDQRSLNIRNNLCHGILPPDSFHFGVAARLLHVLIMIGMVRYEDSVND